MSDRLPRRLVPLAGAAVAFVLTVALPPTALRGQQPSPSSAQRPSFGSAVDLVIVNATVTDEEGHFVRGLSQADFEVREDGRPQTISVFSSDRVPVSLGIALDLSNSMKGDKMRSARAALDRLLTDLLDRDDEIFLYGFSNEPELLQGWTTKRSLLQKALNRVTPGGLTALYDTTAKAVSLAATGKHRKKALVLISDGTDTTSRTDASDLKRQIQESEVLVYAIGIDASPRRDPAPVFPPAPWGYPPDPRGPPALPPGLPGQPRPPRGPVPAPPRAPIPSSGASTGGGEVNASALRALTDDSGGRTEIIRSAGDLGPATAGIADELSRQYFLGYPGLAAHDGKWHAIDVVVRRGDLRVRARKGYMAGTGDDRQPQVASRSEAGVVAGHAGRSEARLARSRTAAVAPAPACGQADCLRAGGRRSP